MDDVGCVRADVVDQMDWAAVEVPAGQTLWFHSRTPHRSGPNTSPVARRALYPTYNARSEGDLREDYYREKLARVRTAQRRGRAHRCVADRRLPGPTGLMTRTASSVDEVLDAVPPLGRGALRRGAVPDRPRAPDRCAGRRRGCRRRAGGRRAAARRRSSARAARRRTAAASCRRSTWTTRRSAPGTSRRCSGPASPRRSRCTCGPSVTAAPSTRRYLDGLSAGLARSLALPGRTVPTRRGRALRGEPRLPRRRAPAVWDDGGKVDGLEVADLDTTARCSRPWPGSSAGRVGPLARRRSARRPPALRHGLVGGVVGDG